MVPSLVHACLRPLSFLNFRVWKKRCAVSFDRFSLIYIFLSRWSDLKSYSRLSIFRGCPLCFLKLCFCWLFVNCIIIFGGLLVLNDFWVLLRALKYLMSCSCSLMSFAFVIALIISSSFSSFLYGTFVMVSSFCLVAVLGVGLKYDGRRAGRQFIVRACSASCSLMVSNSI